jgi:hypothetical protein
MKLRRIPAIAVLSTMLLGGIGCQSSQPIPPLKVVTFVMKWPSIPPVQWSQVRQDLENGARTLADARFQGPGCEFVNDAAASSPPTIRFQGTPGHHDLAFSYSQIGLSRAQNLGNCRPGTNEIPTQVLINPETNLEVGQVSKGGDMVITFGTTGFTADYREFTFTNVDVVRRAVTTRFQMMATNHADPRDARVLVVVDGLVAWPY